MNTKLNILTITVIAALGAASCARNDSPLSAEQQAATGPVRESSWKPAPVRSAAPQAGQPETAPARQAPQSQVAKLPAKQVPTAQPMKVTLAEGTTLAVRVGETLNSEKNESGDTWSGTLAEPVVIDGLVIAERGASVEGRVTNVKRAGRVKGVANMSIALTRITTADGQRVDVHTSGYGAVGKDETKKDVGKVAIASGIGAAIGAIAGGGKGAAIGAGAGAGAGTGVVLATRGGPAVIPNESLVRFRVTEPVTITEKVR